MRLSCISCSHTRMTRQPFLRRTRVVVTSRSILREIFCFQYSRLEWGIRQCLLQPCQKHPSTNIASRHAGKTKSGLPGRRNRRRQPIMRRARRRDTNFRSVDLLPCDLTLAMILDLWTGVNWSMAFLRQVVRDFDQERFVGFNLIHTPIVFLKQSLHAVFERIRREDRNLLNVVADKRLNSDLLT
jgi:hypothetical protein